MKKILLLCAASLSLNLAFADTDAQIPQPASSRTTLYVDIAVERQEIIAGPYARYAQKYLGVPAPLADKVLYEITSAKITKTSKISRPPRVSASNSQSHMSPSKGFPRLTVDKMSAVAVSLEESARAAAATIFEIRKSRFDLITGEVGENVFGGGLESALAELNRLEEEYLSLFLGKQSTRTELKQYWITPSKERPTYIVCRFSQTDGLLPQDDLSGAPVVLEVKPTETAAPTEGLNTQAKPATKPNPKAVLHHVPADVQCRIIFEGAELTSELLTINQLGEEVYILP